LLGIAEEARQAGKRAGKGAGSKANPAGRGGKKVRTHATAGSAGQAKRSLHSSCNMVCNMACDVGRTVPPCTVLQYLGQSVPSSPLQGKRAPVAGSTDEALMARLGEVIQGMKEDFMVVHFREPCSFCRKYLSDEPRCPPFRTGHAS
jgi:hypothetical protein